jgi:WD40 repeat protein/DNA-binding SARP family transcriptional activator/energy-coupling factor transporter ATP-binding protein EcfA2
MEFLILGPIDVRDGSTSIAVGGIKPRAVIAVLLLHANEPVSAERLALALWGEDVPGSAIKTVRVHISRLRKALGDPDILTTTPAGYRLRVRRGELDAHRFEDLVEEGRRTLADGQPVEAAAILGDALALWRGPALAELALEPFAAVEIRRLEEQRLAALELRVQADLAAGRHREVVAELQKLVVDNPTREQLAGQLMLALYRSDRQAEALEAYATARRTLVEQIGVEPGPMLRDLHRAILEHDVALQDEPADAELPPALDPAAAQPLAGRDAELAWLLAQWQRARDGHGGLVVLSGAPGSGKSRLVAELAGAVHEPGVAILHATGDGPADAILAALQRARSATRPTLVVIDDVGDGDGAVHDELAGLVSPLAAAPVLVVCTQDSSATVTVRAGEVLELGSLGSEAVRTIAAGYAPGKPPSDIPADWLLRASGGVPGRVHEIASQWARREAAHRVSAVAGRAEADRSQLRVVQNELAGGVEELQAAEERAARARTEDDRLVCPYKGLAPFDAADAPYFFGRERLIAELAAGLVGASLLGVVGPSGSGKSSVLRAGLLPALASGVLPGSREWTQVLIRPGEHPLRELSQALAGAGDASRVVIAVDQFEETFTACADERERAAFIAELGAAAGDEDGRYVVALALRADFYGRCAAYPELARPLAANHVLVGAMQPDELHRAIERPAERAGLRVDAELADALVADVSDEPGALPLLQTALLELWQHREGRHLRLAAYEQLGGVKGAVARLAEHAYGQLDGCQRAAVRDVLVRLASASEAGGVERRRLPLAELEVGAGDEFGRAVALLVDHRLLTASEGSIELAHEALLHEWPRLRAWVDENREGLRVHRRLGVAAHEWQEFGRDSGALYRGARLTEAMEWAGDHAHAMNEVERRFLHASEDARRLERGQHRRRLRFAIGGLSSAVVLVSAVALVAVLQAREAARQRDIAASRGLAASATTQLAIDPSLSMELALRALGRRDTPQAENVLRQAAYDSRAQDVWPTHDGISRTLSVSRDGRILATGGDDGVIAIRRLDSGRLLSKLRAKDRDPVAGVALSPDGRRVVRAGNNGVVTISAIDGSGARRLMDLSRTRVVQYGSPDYATAVSFSPDGRRIAVGTLDGTVRILPADGPGRPTILRGNRGQVLDLGFGHGGDRVITASYDGKVRVWDVGGGAPVTLKHKAVWSASLSPDGRWVASGGDDKVVRVRRVDGGGRQIVIRVGQPVYSVRFKSDGRRLVTGGLDGVVRIYDVRGGPMLESLMGHRGLVWRAAFLPSGQLVSTAEDGVVRRWAPLSSMNLRGSFVTASFSPDGRHILTGGADGRARVFDRSTGDLVATIGPRAASTVARYSADGSRIVMASQDGSVRIADPRTRATRLLVRPNSAAWNVAADFDPRGKRVVNGGRRAATVRNVSGHAKPVVLRHGHRDSLNDVRFSPDGREVLTASRDGTAIIWDARTAKVKRRLTGHEAPVNSAEFGADGTRIVTAGDDGTIRVWKADGREAPVILRGHVGAVLAAEFSPDGSRIVSAGADGTVRIWDAAGGETLVVLYRHRGAALSASFSPDGRSVVSTGEEDHIARVSSCEVCGSPAAVRQLARTRADRVLNAIERARFLPDQG